MRPRSVASTHESDGESTLHYGGTIRAVMDLPHVAFLVLMLAGEDLFRHEKGLAVALHAELKCLRVLVPCPVSLALLVTVVVADPDLCSS